jgi:hypothetical protein
MRITHTSHEHLVVLSDQEASLLVDACALVVLASQAVPTAVLPAEMAAVLAQLFEELRSPCAAHSDREKTGSEPSSATDEGFPSWR